MSGLILVYGLVAAAAELLGGALIILRKEWPRTIQEYLLALSAGFILALVFIELVPESIHAIGAEAPLVMLLGYAVLHFFEHTVVGHLHFGEETHQEIMVTRAASVSAFVGLFIHAFFDGFAISVGMQFNYYLGVLIFIAVLLHKIPEGLTIASVMIVAKRGRRTSCPPPLPWQRCSGFSPRSCWQRSTSGLWDLPSHSRRACRPMSERAT
jgi:ZIP family zinc transporter/zinc and cadmium transporter